MSRKDNKSGGAQKSPATSKTAATPPPAASPPPSAPTATPTGGSGGPPAANPPPASLRNWAFALLIACSAFGMFVGGLLAWHHDLQLYGSEQAGLIGCVESATVNCDIVNTSAWSEVLGIPTGTLAIPAFAWVGALAALGLRGRRAVIAPLIGSGVLAVLVSAFLFYISKVELGFVCAWCLRLYATSFATLGLSLLAGRPERPADLRALTPAIATLVAVFAFAVGGERVWRSSLLGDSPAALGNAVDALHDDPKGPAPERSFTVTTEEGQSATFTLDPDDAWKGNRDAKVAVVEFADLECGYCKRANSEVARLYAAYGDRVLFVWKHFPMNPECNPGVKNKKHRDACRAAMASVCAQQQGQFWAYADLAFKNQHQLDDEYLPTYAEKLGIDRMKFDTCMRDPATESVVRRDAETGQSLSIHGTPRIFIDGKLYRSGTSAEAMARAIEVALGSSSPDAGAAKLHDNQTAIAAIPANLLPQQPIDAGGFKFKIDTFEAGIGADSKASSNKHEEPAIRKSWFDAKAACEAAGKRMCTEEEWVTACQGARASDDNANGEFADDMIEGTAYPYGDFHEKGRCWDGHEADAQAVEPWRPVYTGEMPGCVTSSGLYDLTGNVEEWVGETPEKAVLLGGAWDTSEDHARCYRRNDTFGAGYASPRTGFRCCSN